MNPQPISYMNTDLDLIIDVDPAILVEELEGKGVCVLTSERGRDSLWLIICEDGKDDGVLDNELVENVTHLLDVIESLSDVSKELWDRCSKREFNAGYECGFEPRSFEQNLPHEVLKRIVACNASFAITLYRPFDETDDKVCRIDLTGSDEEE